MINFQDLITKNVEGLSDDQVKAVADLAQTALNQRVAEVHRQYDQDIAAATGKTKPDGVKTYEWMKQEFAGLKAAANSAAEEATKAANEKIAELQADIEAAKKGGKDSAAVAQLQKELQDAKDLASGLKSQHEKALAEWETKYGELNTSYRRAQTKQELAGMKFRDDLPEDLQKLAIDSAIDYVLGLTAETDTEGRTIYRDGSGKLMTNPDNGLAPYTTAELLQSKLGGVIDKGRKQAGTGTKDGGAKPGQNGSLIVNATTQSEAMQQITARLYEQGIPQGDPRHQEAIDKAWKENNISSLPMQ